MTCLVMPENVLPTMKSLKTGSDGNGASSEASEEAPEEAQAIKVNDPKMPLFNAKVPDYEHEPYKGRYNFAGGKVEPGEESESAAYRELQEETGISRQQIRLFRLMDIRYFIKILIWSYMSDSWKVTLF